MSVLSNLFARQTGGTIVGNLIRRGLNKYTGGLTDLFRLTDGHLNNGRDTWEADLQQNYELVKSKI